MILWYYNHYVDLTKPIFCSTVWLAKMIKILLDTIKTKLCKYCATYWAKCLPNAKGSMFATPQYFVYWVSSNCNIVQMQKQVVRIK